MSLFGPRHVRRLRSGGFRLHLDERETAVVRSAAQSIRSLIEDQGPQAPALRRLFPTAYPDDPEADREYHELMGGDLLASRLAASEVLVEALDGRQLDEEGLLRVMGALNDLRLVLGTVLDVSEELDPGDIDDDDPAAPTFALYWFLGLLQEEVIRAAMR